MKKTMMYLPDDMHRYLARESRERGISMAEVAREAIAQYRVAREQDKSDGVSALIGVLGPDIADPGMSARIDDEHARYFGPSGAWEQENGLADDPR